MAGQDRRSSVNLLLRTELAPSLKPIIAHSPQMPRAPSCLFSKSVNEDWREKACLDHHHLGLLDSSGQESCPNQPLPDWRWMDPGNELTGEQSEGLWGWSRYGEGFTYPPADPLLYISR